MHLPRPLRSLVTTGLVLAASCAVTAAPAHAEPYAATLRAAVRALPVAAEDNAGYDRDAQFGSGWVDVDRDCQSTRHEVLIAESSTPPVLSSSGCTAVTGSWTTSYDDRTYTRATEVEIDHLVPVAEAWGSGARGWTQERRVAFYNDLGYAGSLNAMASALNQAKAASGPEQWLPPANPCRYVEAWTAVKVRWGLSVDPAEQAALVRSADACPDVTLRVDTVAGATTPVAPPAGPATPGVERLAGGDRYATAAAIVRDSFPSGPVPVVVVATGTAYADALAGGPAAHVLGGPILPVAAGSIPAVVRAELARLQPGRIVVLGGARAVSDAVVRELGGYTGGTVTRLAGANRYATAARVATSSFRSGVPQVLIATGATFADALAGGAVGALTDSPVLLVGRTALPAETATALRSLQPRDITVLGGTGAVSDAVVDVLRGYAAGGTVTRLAGADRYATAARITAAFWPRTSDVVYLATGRDFPDALAGVPAAGRDAAPLLLVEPGCMPAATQREIERLQPSTTVVLGGPSTVSAAAAAGVVCGSAPPVAEPVTPPPADLPPRPADVDCSDFATQAAAQAFYDRWFPYYGDVARLDGSDRDGRVCETLP